MRGAIYHADKINTVSETYAAEILTREYGAMMEGELANRLDDVYGILNGMEINNAACLG